jgi:hypothetical protein
MKSIDFFSFQILTTLSFLLSLHDKVFHIEKLHNHSVYSWLYSDIFLNFFKDLKFELFGIQIKGLHGARVLIAFCVAIGTYYPYLPGIKPH